MVRRGIEIEKRVDCWRLHIPLQAMRTRTNHIPFHSCSNGRNPMSDGGERQEINIERALGVIEEKLQDRSCLPHLVALAKRHPESMNAFISLADSIEHDLSMRRRSERMN